MTDPKIVPLSTDRQECIADTIAVLEDILKQAQDGDIVAVAIAYVTAGGGISSRRSRSDDVGRLLGAMSLAQARMLRDIDN